MASMVQQVYGTLLVVCAAMTFAVVAFIVKKDPLPTTLATEARFFVSWVMSVCFMLRYSSEQGLHWFGPPKLRWGLILRGTLMYSFATLWWTALTMAPLGDCIAVIYCDPLLTVLLSAVILREQTLSVFPIQAMLAIIGMCFIIQPPFLLKALGVAQNISDDGNYTLAIVAMIFSASMPIVTNKTKDASWIEVEHVTNFMAVFILNPLVFCVQQVSKGEAVLGLPTVDAWEVGLIIIAALGSFSGVAMQTRGYQLADPGKAAMFTYLEIPLGYLLQHLGTESRISAPSIIGAILVILACLLGGVAHMSESCKDDANEKQQLNGQKLDLPKTMVEP